MHDLQPLTLLPGINTEDSPLAAQGQYVEGNNVRFWKGLPQKVGGCIAYTEEKLIGAARGKVTWQSLNGTRLAAFGTAYGLFLLYNDELFDITPIDTDAFIVNPFFYMMGSKTVKVRIVDHGFATGDRVIFASDLHAGGTEAGDIIDGSYFLTKVDDDHFTIEIPNPVTFIDGLNYGTGTYAVTAYQGEDQVVYFRKPISPGLPVGDPGGGYGSGPYGGGGYGGDTGLFAVTDPARIWTLDHWGENLVACYYRSPIFQWRFQDGPLVPAEILPGAPLEVGTLYVSEDDRILVAQGATDLFTDEFDPKLLRWSDQENNEDWLPTEINYAGDKRVENGSRLMHSVATLSGRLILTDTSAYVLRFIGQPFVYSLTFVDKNCGLAAIHGLGKIDDVAYWINMTGFYMFDGMVRRVPCSLQEQLFGDPDTAGEISVAQIGLVCAGQNKRFRELMFHYPTEEMGGVSKVAALQIDGEAAVWWQGSMARSTWIDDDDFFAYPIGVKEDGSIMIHEYGLNDGPNPLPYSLKTSDMDISDGSYMMQVERMMHDFKRISGTHYLEFTAKESPQGQAWSLGPIAFDRLTTETFIHLNGRSISFRLFSSELSTEFRLGRTRIAAFPRGKKL